MARIEVGTIWITYNNDKYNSTDLTSKIPHVHLTKKLIYIHSLRQQKYIESETLEKLIGEFFLDKMTRNEADDIRND